LLRRISFRLGAKEGSKSNVTMLPSHVDQARVPPSHFHTRREGKPTGKNPSFVIISEFRIELNFRESTCNTRAQLASVSPPQREKKGKNESDTACLKKPFFFLPRFCFGTRNDWSRLESGSQYAVQAVQPEDSFAMAHHPDMSIVQALDPSCTSAGRGITIIDCHAVFQIWHRPSPKC